MHERKKPKPTSQTIKLADALEGRGVKLELEHWDGHKHIDIYVPSAKLYIEVNGLQHYIDPKIIEADLKRAHFSDGDDFFTMAITNQYVDEYLDEIADAVVKVILERMK